MRLIYARLVEYFTVHIHILPVQFFTIKYRGGQIRFWPYREKWQTFLRVKMFWVFSKFVKLAKKIIYREKTLSRKFLPAKILSLRHV